MSPLDAMKKAVDWALEGASEPEPILAVHESCGYCGAKEDRVQCRGFECQKMIPHQKDGFSISHRCLSCNVDDGKGE